MLSFRCEISFYIKISAEDFECFVADFPLIVILGGSPRNLVTAVLPFLEKSCLVFDISVGMWNKCFLFEYSKLFDFYLCV
jgi:hypothetical protein